MSDLKVFNDPENYRAMSVPHASRDEVNEALTKFYEAVRAARNECRIADVTMVITTPVMYPDGESRVLLSFHLGDGNNRESMLAYAFGNAQADRRAQINKLLSGDQKSLDI